MSRIPFHIHNPVKVMHFYAMGMILAGMATHSGHSRPIAHAIPAPGPLCAPSVVQMWGNMSGKDILPEQFRMGSSVI